MAKGLKIRKDLTSELIKKASRLLKGEKLNKVRHTLYILNNFISTND